MKLEPVSVGELQAVASPLRLETEMFLVLENDSTAFFHSSSKFILMIFKHCNWMKPHTLESLAIDLVACT